MLISTKIYYCFYLYTKYHSASPWHRMHINIFPHTHFLIYLRLFLILPVKSFSFYCIWMPFLSPGSQKSLCYRADASGRSANNPNIQMGSPGRAGPPLDGKKDLSFVSALNKKLKAHFSFFFNLIFSYFFLFSLFFLSFFFPCLLTQK